MLPAPRLSFVFVLLSLILCAIPLHAQNSAPDSNPATLRANAKLVIVDVTVTDKQGHAVHNLKQSDFTLLEDKDPQTLKSFDEHTGLSADDAAKLKPAPRMPPGVFTNETSVPANSALNVLLLDTLNTPLQDQVIIRQQLLDYLNKQKPVVNIAIFGLNTHLILLQDFTSDPDTLKLAASQQKNLKASSVLTATVSGNDTTPPPSEILEESNDFTVEQLARLEEFESIQHAVESQMRTRLTLDAMNQLARYLIGIPGRKNLIWFSGAFPFVILPDINRAAPGSCGKSACNASENAASSGAEFRRTIDLLSASQVSVYPVYVQGLTGSPQFSTELGGTNHGNAYAAANPRTVQNDQQTFFQKTFDEHTTMIQLADATGGEAFFDNGLSDAVAKAVANGSSYYTLTYTPTGKRPGDYRSIQVKLQQQGYILAYRRGYYADDPNTHPADKTHDPAASADGPMQLAMKYGAPSATQIPFKVRVLPASEATEDKPALGNQLNPDPQKSAAPFHRYAIDYLADADALGFEKTSGGTYRDDFEYVACVYSLDGTLINVVSNSFGLSLTPAQRATVMQRGLPYHQEVSIPVKGQFVLRVAIHDLKSDRIGALELPVAAVSKLPPLPSPGISHPQ